MTDAPKTRSVLTPAQRRLHAGVLALGAAVLATSVYLACESPPTTEAVARVASPWAASEWGRAGTTAVGGALDVARATLTPYYQALLLAHVLGGLLLLAPLGVFVAWHLRRVWRWRRGRAVGSGIALAAAALVLTASGLFILKASNSRAHGWVFETHRWLAVAGPALYAAHRLWARSAPSARRLVLGLGGTLAAAALLVVAGRGAPGAAATASAQAPATASAAPATAKATQTTAAAAASEPATAPAAPLPADPFVPFVPVNAVPGPSSPFFPSQATTRSGTLAPADTFTAGAWPSPEVLAEDLAVHGFSLRDPAGAAACGGCHASIVDQWSRSAHRFSSFNNPFYAAAVEALRDEPRDGRVRSQWCAGCHDSVPLFTGAMRGALDVRSREAQAGLTCLACHAIERLHNKAGNANFTTAVEFPSPYLFAADAGGAARVLHDALVRSKPAAHKEQMLAPFLRSSEFCSTCHKVSLDRPLNDYRWLRGQNEYDAWHDSGVARNAARTFYLPPARRVCQDCHMPPEPATLGDVSARGGMVRSHRFLAANTALPYLRGDDDGVARTEAFLRDARLRVDVFALRREDGALERALDPERPLAVRPGERVTVQVVVRNQGVGHTFPGGTVDSNEAWVELEVTDADGRVLLRSGGLVADADGPSRVEPDAHFYKVLFVDGAGEPALRRNPQDFHVPVYARVIGPGSADLVRYELRVPDGASGLLGVRARVRWRKFNAAYTRFVFERRTLPRTPRFEGSRWPELPVTDVAEGHATLRVSASADAMPSGGVARAPVELAPPGARPAAAVEPWLRFNDYGIASLLQEDYRAAADAFTEVERLAPTRPDGPRNQARVALSDGRIEEAFAALERAEARAPGDPQTAWWWGQALQQAGRFEPARQAYRRVLAYFPEDRAAWRELGRVDYLDGRFRDALASLQRVLEIDPEDRAAHYQRMLCYEGLGANAAAAEAEKAYRKYQLDDSAARVTQRYRQSHPQDNLESVPLHHHPLAPPPAP